MKVLWLMVVARSILTAMKTRDCFAAQLILIILGMLVGGALNC